MIEGFALFVLGESIYYRAQVHYGESYSGDRSYSGDSESIITLMGFGSARERPDSTFTCSGKALNLLP